MATTKPTPSLDELLKQSATLKAQIKEQISDELRSMADRLTALSAATGMKYSIICDDGIEAPKAKRAPAQGKRHRMSDEEKAYIKQMLPMAKNKEIMTAFELQFGRPVAYPTIQLLRK